MAHLANDLAVTLPEDRPGMLAKAIGAVSGAGINLEGYAELEGVVHVLTPDVGAARNALEASGFQIVRQQQVALVSVEDKPGSAAQVFQKIAKAKVNLTHSYLATGNRLVIGAKNLESVIEALGQD